jgi:hypothetical protein
MVEETLSGEIASFTATERHVTDTMIQRRAAAGLGIPHSESPGK